RNVTGVQTCALPISGQRGLVTSARSDPFACANGYQLDPPTSSECRAATACHEIHTSAQKFTDHMTGSSPGARTTLLTKEWHTSRSEERRVGTWGRDG